MVKAQAKRSFVAYYRVSTQRQGRSGLGLEAQEAAVAGYVGSVGGSIAGSFTEIESGRRADRPKLKAALAQARQQRATLVVAKLDRLARNVSFLATLMDSEVEFVCCDMPQATRLTIQILAAVAEDEADRISRRVKEALAARKARGLPLGNPENFRRHPSPAPKMNRRKAQADAERMRPVVEAILRDDEPATLRELCGCLNDRGYATTTGKQWHPTTANRLLARLDMGLDE